MLYALLTRQSQQICTRAALSSVLTRPSVCHISRRIIVDMGRPKRKSSAIVESIPSNADTAVLDSIQAPPPAKRRVKAAKAQEVKPEPGVDGVIDGQTALRASPDASGDDEKFDIPKSQAKTTRVKEESESVPSLVDDGSSLSELSETEPPPPKAAKKPKPVRAKAAKAEPTPKAVKAEKSPGDPEADEDEEADEEEIQEALSRPPPVNSDYLPLPWKGRIGYACLNTYLRFSNPPVFSSRTCRIASIIEHRHPLKNPNEPEHATKNRPDKDQPADIRRGMEYVENLGITNARDIVKMLRWNDKYGIKFLRLSSEMFPFASHEEYGYKLAPFASEVLAEAGKVAAELGHRLTTHPGQFTQLGSPRQVVIDNALRDLDYHAELLSLLKLPPQQDRDAVMILHLGGVFGDKEATLQRFRENYIKLPDHVKKRLVLENDDVSWSVHELLPLCEELNIPMVLDFHHHNIIFDNTQIREGTKDIIDLFPRILATWARKNITPKMHYSEPTPQAITGRQRRKHSPRVATLPPCPPTMDLMIEAKDKEQAVFELMRTFKLPGFQTFNDIIPHVRKDDNKVVKVAKKKVKKGEPEPEPEEVKIIPEEEVGMGGPEGRVYWPPGMEEWLRPVKRVVVKKEDKEEKPKVSKLQEKMAAAKARAAAAATGGGATGAEEDIKPETTKSKKTPAKKVTKKTQKKVESEHEETASDEETAPPSTTKRKPPQRSASRAKAKYVQSEDEMEE